MAKRVIGQGKNLMDALVDAMANFTEIERLESEEGISRMEAAQRVLGGMCTPDVSGKDER